jgi:hypothetical protein
MKARIGWISLVFLVCGGTGLSARAAVSTVASGCSSLPAGSATMTITFTQAVPQNQMVLLTIATDLNFPLGTVTDTRNNGYAGAITRFNTGLVFLRRAQVNTAIQSGDQINMPFSGITAGGMRICAHAYAVSNPNLPVAEDQIGSNAGESNTLSTNLQANTTAVPELLHAAGFTLGDTGAVTNDPNFANHFRLCSSGNAVCLLTAVREVSSTGNFTWSTTIASSRTWGAAMATYRLQLTPQIFQNGFENSVEVMTTAP